MAILADRIQQVEAIKNGKGMQYLLNEAYRILKNPIMMFDTDYCLIASVENIITDDLFWNEITKLGTFSLEAQQAFKEDGFIDAVANAKTLAYLISPRNKYDRMLAKVFSRNNTHIANLVLVACNQPFEGDDAAVFEAVSRKFSEESSADKTYQDYEMAYQETLIRRLAEGTLTDKELYAAHVSILYNSLKTNLYAAVADFSKCDQHRNKLPYYRDLFRHTHPAFKYAIFGDYVLMIISTDSESFNPIADMGKLFKLLHQRGIYVGISSRFENIYELPERYGEAVSALNAGMAGDGGENVFVTKDEPA